MITKIAELTGPALHFAVNRFLGRAHRSLDDVELFSNTVEREAIKHNIHFVQHFKNGGGVAFCYEPSANKPTDSWDFKKPQVGYSRTVALARVALSIRFGSEVELPDCFDKYGELVLDADGETVIPPNNPPYDLIENF
jgi:hypothetical protein